MAVRFSYREGTTDAIEITLLDGITPADITGYTKVSLFLRSDDGASQSEASTTDSGITVTTASAGAIKLHPALLTSPLLFSKEIYKGYIIVEFSSTRASFPDGDEFQFVMKERFSGDG